MYHRAVRQGFLALLLTAAMWVGLTRSGASPLLVPHIGAQSHQIADGGGPIWPPFI